MSGGLLIRGVQRHWSSPLVTSLNLPAEERFKPRTRRWRGPSVAVRGNADGAHRPPQLCTPTVVTAYTDRPYSTDPVRYASVDSAI